MKIVIDTNVLMAGLLRDSTVRAILILSDSKFILPEYSISEIKKHEIYLLEKSGYSKEDFKRIMNLLLEKIEVIDKERINPYMKQADEIMKHIDIDDSPFIATALAENADGIWSFDDDFKKQKVIKVFEIKDFL